MFAFELNQPLEGSSVEVEIFRDGQWTQQPNFPNSYRFYQFSTATIEDVLFVIGEKELNPWVWAIFFLNILLTLSFLIFKFVNFKIFETFYLEETINYSSNFLSYFYKYFITKVWFIQFFDKSLFLAW